jgi:hypothetical protein
MVPPTKLGADIRESWVCAGAPAPRVCRPSGRRVTLLKPIANRNNFEDYNGLAIASSISIWRDANDSIRVLQKPPRHRVIQ